MKTVYQIINDAKACQKNGKIYLIEAISEYSGIFTCDGDILYLVRNDEKCLPLSIMTEYLQMSTAIFVQSFDGQRSFQDAEYNILRYKSDCIDDHVDNVESFINLCVSHTNLLNGKSFEQFFYSLISLFQLPREQNFLNLEGLFGELSVIQHLFRCIRIDISSSWHSDGPFSKYDFSLSNRKSIEVKSSSKGDKSVPIKHSQLFSAPNKVCLASVHVLEDNAGQTVEELINSMRSNREYCNNLQFELALQKELKRVAPDEINSKRFISESIHFFTNSSINPFPTLPDNINGMEYKLDLSDCNYLDNSSLEEFITM